VYYQKFPLLKVVENTLKRDRRAISDFEILASSDTSSRVILKRAWCDFITNVIDCNYLPRALGRINKITMQSIMITLKVITINIAITFVFKHPQTENKTHLHGLMFKLIFRQYIISTNATNKIKNH